MRSRFPQIKEKITSILLILFMKDCFGFSKTVALNKTLEIKREFKSWWCLHDQLRLSGIRHLQKQQTILKTLYI